MINQYKRTNFMKLQTNGSGSLEWDLIDNNWDLFVLNRPVYKSKLKMSDIARPDVFSYRIYGDTTYWWILCKINQIDDVWNDMYVGMEFIIPDKADITDFYNNVRRRFRI